MKLKSTMGAWRKRKIVKGSRASQTTGKSKGCVTSQLRKFMCRRNRSWKHPLYGLIMGGGEFPKGGKAKKA